MVGGKASTMASCTAFSHGAESRKRTGQFSRLLGPTLFVHCTVPVKAEISKLALTMNCAKDFLDWCNEEYDETIKGKDNDV